MRSAAAARAVSVMGATVTLGKLSTKHVLRGIVPYVPHAGPLWYRALLGAAVSLFVAGFLGLVALLTWRSNAGGIPIQFIGALLFGAIGVSLAVWGAHLHRTAPDRTL